MRQLSSLCAAAAVLWAGSASAQDYGGPADADLAVQKFRPITGPHGVFTVDSARAAEDLQLSSGVLFNYQRRPLVLEDKGEVTPIVEGQFTADVLVGIGLGGWLEFGADLPVYALNEAVVSGQNVGGATLGDLRLSTKVELLDTSRAPVGVAIVASLSLPTGDPEKFTGTGQWSGQPGLVVDAEIGDVLLATNLGVSIQSERGFGKLTVGNELLYGAGALWKTGSPIDVGAELYGSTDLDAPLEFESSPLEAVLGVRAALPWGFGLDLGVGRGLIGGYGAPEYRFFGGLRFASLENNDWDGDGIANAADLCPRTPEDLDDFEDGNGCPDPDNDNDGILDVGDSCPLEPEDFDSFEDRDGCPDPNNDQDGLLDTDDRCPDDPGPDANGGCPDRGDNDRDGDGLVNELDSCPDDPEDNDGFDDDDGCPDTDNDADGILDVDDKCPNDPEVFNQIEDDDGCPDARTAKVVVTRDEIKILERVYFDTDKDAIKRRSYDVLSQVAAVMKSHPDIELVEIQGHTDDRGSDAYNLDLSERRAFAVRHYLLDWGVPEGRVLAKGYGETEPAERIDGRSGRSLARARERNRRVQFIIRRRVGGATRVETR